MTKPHASDNPSSAAFRKLMKYIRPLRGILAAVILLSFAGSVLNVLVPTFVSTIANEIQAGITCRADPDAIRQNVIFTAAALLTAFACNLLQAHLSPLLSQRTAHRLRRDMNGKTNRIPLNYFDTTKEGDTLSVMTNDIDTLSTAFSSTLPVIITSVTTLLGCIILMFVTNPVLAVTTIVSTAIGSAVSVFVLGKGQPWFRKNQQLLGELNAKVNEDIRGHLIIKSYNAEDEVVESFRQTNQRMFDSMWRSQLVTSLMVPLSVFASNFSYIGVCVVGAVLVMTGNARIGTIIAFIQYAQLFASPVSQLFSSLGSIQPAMAAGDRIFAVLDQPEMRDEGKTQADVSGVRGEVEFSHVSFGYSPDRIIVHDFSCLVKPGQKIAIVGPTGAGKSTLINLLTRFYEVNRGDIRIDGVSIYDMPRETLHRQISMVLQETWTFQGTIRDNIVYAAENVPEERLNRVIRDCGLEDFIGKCDRGLDTVLREDADISAGQKQLITIARAMIDNAPILILDEATSSVDTRTEQLISAVLDRLVEGRTSFVIAHRLSTIQNADRILVLKDGDILETGTHAELMARKGFYADLYLSQFDHGEEQN